MTDNILMQMGDLSRYTIDELICRYDQENKTMNNRYKYGFGSLSNQYQNQLGTPNCIASVLQGTVKNITVNVATAGTPGYVYKLYVDNVLKQTYPTSGTTNELSHVFSYTFSESIGSHEYKGTVTDSCLPANGGPKIDESKCNINITTTTPTKYNCVSGACQGPYETGQYNSLIDCQNAIKYGCINNSCTTVCPDYTGTKYDSLNACQAACAVPKYYNCVSGACQGPFVTGTYDSLSACQAACTTASHKVCNSTTKKCEQVTGPGTDECSTIGTNCYHNVCNATTNKCEQVIGGGIDECTTVGADCPTAHHKVCNSTTKKCEQVSGAGTDECTTIGADCTKCWIDYNGKCYVREDQKTLAIAGSAALFILLVVALKN